MRRGAYVARNGLIGCTSSDTVLCLKGPSRCTSSHRQRAAPHPTNQVLLDGPRGGKTRQDGVLLTFCSLFSGSFLVASYAVDYIGLDEDVAGRCGLVLPYHSSTGAFTGLDTERRRVLLASSGRFSSSWSRRAVAVGEKASLNVQRPRAATFWTFGVGQRTLKATCIRHSTQR